MPEPPPIARFFASMDALLEHTEPTWWGAVVTDARFPHVYDLNYARVDRAARDLALADVEATLLPALLSSEANYFHVVVFEPDGCPRLIEDLRRAGHSFTWDNVMEFEGPTPNDLEPSRHRVHELDPKSEDLGSLQDLLLREFGVRDDETRRQMITWSREVLAPAGRRWFGVEIDGRIAGMGSLHPLAGIAYVDDVLTLPGYRRRGVATAIVNALVREARAGGAAHVLLLSDEPAPIRLYRTLGFVETGRAASVTSPIGGGLQKSGSSGSA